jgi:hypothetical protein
MRGRRKCPFQKRYRQEEVYFRKSHEALTGKRAESANLPPPSKRRDSGPHPFRDGPLLNFR